MGGGTPIGPKVWNEWNVNELTDLSNYDEISGFPVYKSLLCDVVKIEKGKLLEEETAKDKSSIQEEKLFNLEIQQGRPERIIYLDNNATTPTITSIASNPPANQLAQPCVSPDSAYCCPSCIQLYTITTPTTQPTITSPITIQTNALFILSHLIVFLLLLL